MLYLLTYNKHLYVTAVISCLLSQTVSDLIGRKQWKEEPGDHSEVWGPWGAAKCGWSVEDRNSGQWGHQAFEELETWRKSKSGRKRCEKICLQSASVSFYLLEYSCDLTAVRSWAASMENTALLSPVRAARLSSSIATTSILRKGQY